MRGAWFSSETVVVRSSAVGYTSRCQATHLHNAQHHSLTRTLLRPFTTTCTPLAELVLPHGYPLQVHIVTTEDGFLLTLLRIPHGLATMSDATGTNLFKQTTDPITRSSTQPHDRTHAAHTAADSNTGHAAGRGSTHGGGGKRTSPGDGLALRRPVVFLQHGLLDSAAGYLVNGPGKSLGFILADLGERGRAAQGACGAGPDGGRSEGWREDDPESC